MPHPVARSVISRIGPLGAVLIACAPAGGPAPATAATPGATAPRLIVMITVDQLRGDMLERYQSDLRFGLARLTRGAWFTNAFQDHAITETAPGHASVMSGRFPASTGIISNSEGVVDRDYPLIIGTRAEAGASPERLQGTTLTDWLVAKDPRTRVVSVSAKDRAAILPIGRSKGDVYWYSLTGAFTTSSYYRAALPAWVSAFNARRIPQSYAGKSWSLSRPASSYAEPDSVPWEKGGVDFLFPHQYPRDSVAAASYFRATPSMDSLTALFALEALGQTGIGRGPQTDVMSVSFSATDLIGHAYGPDSREAHENVIRLDQTIGWFLDSLYALRDSSTVMIAMTADHGVSPIPELARERGQATGDEGRRVSLKDEVATIKAGIHRAGGDSGAFYYDVEVVALNRPGLTKARINPDSVLDQFARLARRVPGILRVDRMAELRKANFDRDPVARRWVHQIPDGSPVEQVLTLTKYSFWWPSVATHGSPHDYDAFVPIIFYGPWVKPGKYSGFTRTVDIGTTLAAIAGVRPLERVDGVVLKAAIR